MSLDPNNGTIREIQLGAICASIREEIEDGDRRFKAEFCRKYKSHGNWEKSREFDQDDLPVLSVVLKQTQEWIRRRSQIDAE